MLRQLSLCFASRVRSLSSLSLCDRRFRDCRVVSTMEETVPRESLNGRAAVPHSGGGEEAGPRMGRVLEGAQAPHLPA